MIGPPQRRTYNADEVDAYTGPLEAEIATLRRRLTARMVQAPAADSVNNESQLFLNRARRLAERSAEDTVAAARHEASEVLQRARDEARDQVADAQIKATMLVSAVHGRIDSLAVGWEHRLLKQISDTRHGMLADLDSYAAQLRAPTGVGAHPDVDPQSGTCKISGSVPADQATGAPLVADPEKYLASPRPRATTPEPRPDADLSHLVVVPAEPRPPKRRRNLNLLRMLRLLRPRRATLRGERITTGDDPFYNPELRWQDNCGDEEFLSFLRFGGNPPSQ